VCEVICFARAQRVRRRGVVQVRGDRVGHPGLGELRRDGPLFLGPLGLSDRRDTYGGLARVLCEERSNEDERQTQPKAHSRTPKAESPRPDQKAHWTLTPTNPRRIT